MIKANTFDLDGVYFPDGKAKFIKKLGELGVSEDEAKRVFLISDQMNEQYKNGKMTDDEYWSWAAKEWELEKSPSEIIDMLVGSYSVDDEVKATVQAVRKNGYKTLVCTNNFPARIKGLQAKFHFLNDFDAAVSSHEVGVNKPDKKIFEELIKRSGVKPEEIVFADDNPVNLSGAKDLGISTFLYEDFEQFITQLKELGVEFAK